MSRCTMSSKPKKRKGSVVWNYFDNKTKTGATCMLCQQVVQSSGNTTNYMNHLKYAHKISKDNTGDPGDILETAIATINRTASPTMTNKRKSIVWNYFENKTKTGATCMFCQKVVQSSGNTTNYMNHLKCAHNMLKDNTEDGGESETGLTSNNNNCISSAGLVPNIRDKVRNTKDYVLRGEKASKITDAIVGLIARDNLPIDTVDGIGFQQLMKVTAPHYKIPSRKSITKCIDEKYAILVESKKNMIETVMWLSLTTDMWTESNTSYISVTAHYLEGERHESFSLAVERFDNSHTADDIKTYLENTLAEWKIYKDKVVACVTGNEAIIVNAVQDLLGPSKHILCFAHTLNVVAQDSLNNSSLQELISKVRSIVMFFAHNTTASDELKRAQALDGVEIQSKLTPDVAMRWNSTYTMLEQYIVSHIPVSIALSKLTHYLPVVTANEVEHLKDVFDILKPIHEVMLLLSGETFSTISTVIPLIRCLTSNIEALQPSCELGIVAKASILLSIEEHFSQIEFNHLAACATVLDPRFKRLHFVQPSACAKALQLLSNSLKLMAAATSEAETNEVDSESIWALHDQLASSRDTGVETVGGMDFNLRQYIQLPVVNRHEDVLKFWEQYKIVYPEMAKLARKHFCVTATSVQAERLFSKAGSLVHEKRKILCGKRVNKLVFLSSLPDYCWDE